MKQSLRLLAAAALFALMLVVAATEARAKHAAKAPVLVVPADGYVVVPNSPSVQYIPNGPLDVFQHNGRYYVWQNGWYVADKPGKRVVYVNRAQVPRDVLLVPGQYYRVPPGQAKKIYGVKPHGKHRHHDHDHDDDD